MIDIQRSDERGHADHGWLDARHSFSFGNYHNPERMGFRTLRVINEDRIAGGTGFPEHPHRDMEIITYVLAGELEHRDSLGNKGSILPGEVQRMTAGRGIYHGEKNASATDDLKLLQIWITPREPGLDPSYEQKRFDVAKNPGRLIAIATPDAREGSLLINQDAAMFAGVLNQGQSVAHELSQERHAWVQLIRGSLSLNDETLHAGDSAALSNESIINITANEESEFLLFDLN